MCEGRKLCFFLTEGATRSSELFTHVLCTVCCWNRILLQFSSSLQWTYYGVSYCWWIFRACGACEPFGFHFTPLHAVFMWSCWAPKRNWAPREPNGRKSNPVVRYQHPGVWSSGVSHRSVSNMKHLSGFMDFTAKTLINACTVLSALLASDFSCLPIV